MCVEFILKGRKLYQARMLLREVAEGMEGERENAPPSKKNDDAFKILKLRPYSLL